MELKDFEKYIRGKSVLKLLHRARKNSLGRILASEKEFMVSRRRPTAAKHATGTK
jgi:hypothetical protein